MKLSENNSKFAVVRTAFHGGGTISFHISLEAARRAEHNYAQGDCTCGCCAIVPVTNSALKELIRVGYYEDEETPLYNDLPAYSPDFAYFKICR